MIDVECIESPQRDSRVVADGRVVAVYLEEEGNRSAQRAAMQHGKRLRAEYGLARLTHGTTWRSRAFDHLEDLSCLRRTCCRFIARDGPADWEGDG